MNKPVRSNDEQEVMSREPLSEDLMIRTARGDEGAFEILVNRHQTSVLNLTYLSFHRGQDACKRPGPGSVYTGLEISQKL
jgi:hypothetical protein